MEDRWLTHDTLNNEKPPPAVQSMCALELQDGNSKETTKGISDLRARVQDSSSEGHSLLFIEDREKEDSLELSVSDSNPHFFLGSWTYTREELSQSAFVLQTVDRITHSSLGEPKNDSTDGKTSIRVDRTSASTDHSPSHTHTANVCQVSATSTSRVLRKASNSQIPGMGILLASMFDGI